MEYRGVALFVLVILTIGTLTMISVEMIDVVKGSGKPMDAVLDVTSKLLVSIVFFLIASSIDYRVHSDPQMLLIYHTITLSLLASTFFFGGSAHRWLRIGGFSFQPSEIAKILVILTVAYRVSKGESTGNFWKGVLRPLVDISPLVVLVALEPDLSTSLLLLFLAILMIYTAGAKLGHVLIVIGVLIGMVILAFSTGLMKSYQIRRLTTFFEGKVSEQVMRALESVRSGGILGKGISLGEVKMTVPVVESDFVLAVVGEELGYVGIAVLLLSYLGLVYSLIRAAEKSVEDPFGRMIIVGYAYLVMLQVMVNVGVSTGMLPITGITLPFVSKGGSSLLSFMTGLGIVFNVFYGGKEG